MTKKIMPSKIMRGVRFYIVEDLVKILGLTPGAVRDYLRKDKIASIKVGLRFYVSEKSLSDFLMCKTIRNLPDDRLVSMVNKMVEITFNEYVDNQLVPCIKDVIRELNTKKEEVIPEQVAEKVKHIRYKKEDLVKI